MKRFTTILVLIFIAASGSLPVYGQVIDFSKYSNYDITLAELSSTDLDFGTVISGEGPRSIDLPDSKVISITGVKYLDVIVDIQADQALTLNGSGSTSSNERIPYTLQAAYSNHGTSPNYSGARFINVSSNTASVTFPLSGRNGGPPAPPPVPPHKGYTPPQATAYLYLYGQINVGNVKAGYYNGQVTVTVTYD